MKVEKRIFIVFQAKKDKRTNKDLQNTTQKSTDRVA
jgi:hypothetical protein